MGFNEEELIRIRDATSGFLKGKARKQIANSLSMIASKISELSYLSAEEQKKELIELLNIFTASRQLALQRGANGYGHAGWAASAACESWLQEILSGTPESIARVDALVKELVSRG